MPAGLYARPGFLTAQADIASQEGRVYAEGLHSSAHMRMANVPSCSLGLRSSASALAASPIVWQPPTQQTGAGHVRGRAWHTASGRNSMGISILCPPHPWATPAGHEGMRVWSFVRCLIDSEGQAPGTAPSPGLLPPAALWSCSSSPPLPGEIGLLASIDETDDQHNAPCYNTTLPRKCMSPDGQATQCALDRTHER